MDSIISNDIDILTPYVYRQRCLSEILLLYGHIHYQPKKILKGLGHNFMCFLRFPLEYLKLTIRIVYVKMGEWSGFYRINYKF